MARVVTLERVDAAFRGLARVRGIQSRHVHVQGAVVHLLEGDGRGHLPTLVLQHGLGAGSASQFVTTMLSALRDFARVVAIDLPGHGLSEPLATMTSRALYASVAEVLDTHTSGPLVLVGNSLGGAMMLEYALERPERVDRLMLTSPAGAPATEDERAELLALFGMDANDAAKAFFARMHPREPVWARFFYDDVRESFSRPHVRALVDSFRDGAHFDPARLQQHRVPTLFLWGTADRLLPSTMLAWWRTHLPATFEEPVVGHAPHLDAPRDFYARLRAFASN